MKLKNAINTDNNLKFVESEHFRNEVVDGDKRIFSNFVFHHYVVFRSEMLIYIAIKNFKKIHYLLLTFCY